MSEDIEERFRVACMAYLAAAEHADSCRAAAGDAAQMAREAEQAADRARDQLLRVVRERDATARLAAAGPPVPVIAVIDADGRDTGATVIGGRIHPSPRAQAAADEFRARYRIAGAQEGPGNAGDAVQEYDDQGRPVIEDD